MKKTLLFAVLLAAAINGFSQKVAGVPILTTLSETMTMMRDRYGAPFVHDNRIASFSQCKVGDITFDDVCLYFDYYNGARRLVGGELSFRETTDMELHKAQVKQIHDALSKKYKMRYYNEKDGTIANSRIYYSGGGAEAKKLGAENTFLFVIEGHFTEMNNIKRVKTTLRYGPLRFSPQSDF